MNKEITTGPFWSFLVSKIGNSYKFEMIKEK